MIWFILIVGIVAVGWGASAYLKGQLKTNLARAVILTKMAMFTELSKRCSKNQGEEDGTLLAGAVVNYLFNSPPTNQQAAEYLEAHLNTVESLAAEYVKHAGVREALTQALLHDRDLPSAEGERSAEEKKRHCQALLQKSWINSYSLKKTPQDFLDLVAKFSMERPART